MHYIVDLALLCGELSAARICTGEVGSIVGVALGTGIHHQETARGDDLMVRMVMKGLTVLGEDGRE